MLRPSALLLATLLAPLALAAQTRPAARPGAKPAAKAPAKPGAPKAGAAKAVAAKAAAGDEDAPAPAPAIAPPPMTPARNPDALKIKTEFNAIERTLTMHCDAPGPTRFEVNDKDGRPVLTKTMMAGTSPVVLPTASLPAGRYVVRCTAGQKTGVKMVELL